MTIDELIAHINASPQHKYLYHFTDESNLKTIAEKGLVSKSQMRAEGWWPATALATNWMTIAAYPIT